MHTRETEKPRWFPRPRRRPMLLLIWLLALSPLAQATTDESYGLQLRNGEHWQPSLVMDTSVDMRVRGLLAEVRIRQTYRNDSGQWREGRYLLPLPENAAVDALTVRIGERLIEGEIREKAQARALYDAAAANGQRASLVEQNRPNLFRTAVANIAPNEEVEIEVRYWQAVDYRDGVFGLGLPLTLTPRYTPASTCTDCDTTAERVTAESLPATPSSQRSDGSLPPSVSITALIDAGLPLQRVHSPSHAVTVSAEGSQHRVILSELVEPSDRDFLLRWQPEPSRAPRSAVFTEQIDGEHYALVMLVPPTLPTAPLARELTLVIDNSGSMMGASMEQAKQAADQALARLRPGDRFNVIRFDDDTESLFTQPVPAEPANVAQARLFVRALRAEGGTEMLPALQAALAGSAPEGYLRQVVLATDAAIGNEDQLLQVIVEQRGNARLFPIGIGSAPNGHFLRKSAELGRGSQVLIRDVGEVAARMDELLAKLDRPAMRDIRIDWPGPAEMYPAQVPDLYQGESLQVVAKLDRVEGLAQVSGLAPQAWIRPLALNGASARQAAGVGRIWARQKIEALEDVMRTSGQPDEVRSNIVDTALRHGLVSRYTSLVAIERNPARPLDETLASTQISNASPDGSLMLAQGSTGWLGQLLLAVALAGLALAFSRSRS